MKTKEKSFKLSAAILERNKKFKAASPAQKRVMIAKDAKKQILAQKIIPTEGEWASAVIDLEKNLSPNETFCLLNKDMPQCDACGLGALFISAVRFRDNATLDWMGRIRDSRTEGDPLFALTEFSAEQRKLIECAFEYGSGAVTEDQVDGGEEAMVFGRNEGDPTKRLLAILDNIIKNKGTFKP